MWQNLLTGTIGAVVGLVGAVVVAVLTVQSTRRQTADSAETARQQAAISAETARKDHAAHAELQRQIDKSGDLANHLVALYEELRIIVRRDTEPTPEDLERVRIVASGFRRSVVVDAPLLSKHLETPLKESRRVVSDLLDRPDATITKNDLADAQASVRAAGDELRDFRSSKTDEKRKQTNSI